MAKPLHQVANAGTNAITEYAPGTQTPARTIVHGVEQPTALTFDSSGNLLAWRTATTARYLPDSTPGDGVFNKDRQADSDVGLLRKVSISQRTLSFDPSKRSRMSQTPQHCSFVKPTIRVGSRNFEAEEISRTSDNLPAALAVDERRQRLRSQPRFGITIYSPNLCA